MSLPLILHVLVNQGNSGSRVSLQEGMITEMISMCFIRNIVRYPGFKGSG